MQRTPRATGIGSLPGTDVGAAHRLVFDELPDLAFLPELPARGVGADMAGRGTALLVDFYAEVQPSGWRLADRPGRDARRAAAFLRQDLDSLEENAQDFTGTLKVQAVGPWTLAATLELRHGDRMLSDLGAVRELAESLTEGLKLHLAEIRKRAPRAGRVLLQLDEPALPGALSGTVPTASGFGRLRAVDEPVARELLAQFPVIEKALEAMGIFIWPMVELEADDALASAAAVGAEDPTVDRVVICTPDKDLGQCVTADGRIVQLDRRTGTVLDRAGVTRKFGVPPESIPDYLALVGDSADGFPGLPGWGAKSAAAVLARYGRLEDIPALGISWDVDVRGAGKLAATLQDRLDEALLFRRIATLELDAPVSASVEDLRWTGPAQRFAGLCEWLDAPRLAERADALAAIRAGDRREG